MSKKITGAALGPHYDDQVAISPAYAELRKLAEAATPGPWAYEAEDNMISYEGYKLIAWQPRRNNVGLTQRCANGDYIAAANPAAILSLLDALASRPAAHVSAPTAAPQGFIDYIAANYYGTVEFLSPEWHAERLWRAAMYELRPAPADSSAAPSEAWAEVGTKVRHIRTSGMYEVTALAKCKINEQWAPVVVYRASDRDETFVRESGPFHENFQCVGLAAQPAPVSAPTKATLGDVWASGGVHWDLFPGYLIDHREGDVLTEEGLQFALAAMLKDADYLRVVAERAALAVPAIPAPTEQPIARKPHRRSLEALGALLPQETMWGDEIWPDLMEYILDSYTASRAAPDQPAVVVPEGYVVAPHYRGYANLGTGQYLLNHSEAGEVVSLIISVATDEEKAGRVVGDERANPTHAMLQPEAMAVRIDFTTVAGLDALEVQLRKLRVEHFAAAPTPSKGEDA